MPFSHTRRISENETVFAVLQFLAVAAFAGSFPSANIVSLNFSYVCPEPVLAKDSGFSVEWCKKDVSAPPPPTPGDVALACKPLTSAATSSSSMPAPISNAAAAMSCVSGGSYGKRHLFF